MTGPVSKMDDHVCTRYAVECMIPIYDVITVFVEAASVDEACRLATDAANVSPDWQRMDDCGELFVIGIGADPDPDDPTEAIDCSDILIPDAYAEPGKRPHVRIILEAGQIKDLIVTRGSAEIEIENRDD